MKKSWLFAVALLYISSLGGIKGDNCGDKISCGACIQTEKCSWCMQPDFGNQSRCYTIDSSSNSYCDETSVVNPDNEQVTLRNDPLSTSSTRYPAKSPQARHDSENIVPLAPQHVQLKLRVNEKFRLSVNYAAVQDYPLDLYYLMDLSKSMEDDKEKVSLLGDNLSETMKSITSNFRIGFGSFVDKVLMPYVSTVPKNLKTPCDGCEAPYGYRNHMSLSTNTIKFAENVAHAPISGNLDSPEGGFDALMQAIVCRAEIGWRAQARHVIVFSTDAGYHIAGDGKLGGVLTPNDGACHMNQDLYTHSSIQDYPSVAHINYVAKKHAANIIFAVTKEKQETYKKLSENVKGSSVVVLSYDSSDVVEIIRDEYKKISSSVELIDNAPESVKVSYYSKCLGSERQKTNRCDGLQVGDAVSFEAEIVLISCPADPKERKLSFQISSLGDNRALTVDIEMLCDCGCSSRGEANSETCSAAGTLACGTCNCNEGFFGHQCECSTDEFGLESEIDTSSCRNGQDSSDCSGRGVCHCGQCYCDKGSPEETFSGRFCQVAASHVMSASE